MGLKWIVAVSILLPLISRMSTEAAGTSGGLAPMELQHQAILDQYGKFIMLWTPLQKDIIIEIQVATTGFIGIGFSPSGGMKGADIVLAWVDDQTGKLNVHDRFAHGMMIPVIDDSQDIDVLGGHQNDTHTILRFSRPWNSCDSAHDFKLSGDTTRVIWAYSKEDPAGDMDMSIHDYRGTKSIYLQEPRFNLPTFSEDVKSVDYLNSAVKLPDDLDTLYWCDVFKIPDISKKHHLIGYVPIIQEGNHEHVHHILLQECHVNESSVHYEQWLQAGGRQCLVANMPPSWMFCSHTIFAWAIGSEGDLLPEHVGLPMGEDYGGANYYVLQVHYDNPKFRKGVVDSSGLRIFYTDQLREIDAGVIMVGSNVKPTMIVPPGQKWTTVGICSGDCTEKSFPKDGIRVFQGLLHAHLLGHSITIKQIRNGRELPIVFQDMNYDFNYQQQRILKEEMLILPGDTLIVECGYDSTKRAKPTFGGEGTEQEMCLSYLTYYPRIDISDCLSVPQLPTIYESLGVQEVYYKDEKTSKTFSGRGRHPGIVKSIDVSAIKRKDKQLLENPDADIKNVDFALVFKKVMLKHPQEFENITLYDFLHDDNTWKNLKVVAALQEHTSYQPQLVACHNTKSQAVEGVNRIVKYPDFITFKSLEEDECASSQQSEVYETYGMGIRKQQVMLGAMSLLLLWMYTQNSSTDRGVTESKNEVQRLIKSQDANLHDMMDAVANLQHQMDDLADQVQKEVIPNPIEVLPAGQEMQLPEQPPVDEKEEIVRPDNYYQDVHNGRLVSSSGKPVKVIVLVGSTARSGTSFLGELLSQYDNFLYLFEPELFVRVITKEMVTEEPGMSHLQDMMYCHLSESFTKWLTSRATAFNIFRHPVTKTHCRIWSTCLTVPKLTQACREEDIRIMKVIRVRMAWMRVLLDNPQVDVKVIHLVRDPRGSLFSMAKNHLHKLEPDYYCPLIEDDIVQTPKLMEEYPGKVMGLTYEELCLDPIGKATEIWRFLEGDSKTELSPKWAEYMEKHMSRASKRRVSVYGTFRNSAEQYQAWRNNITENALIEIEANCKGVLSRLGYNLFGSLERTRNISYPLFINPPPYL